MYIRMYTGGGHIWITGDVSSEVYFSLPTAHACTIGSGSRSVQTAEAARGVKSFGNGTK